MHKKDKARYFTRKRGKKQLRRRRVRAIKKLRRTNHLNTLKSSSRKKGIPYVPPLLPNHEKVVAYRQKWECLSKQWQIGEKPDYSETIRFLATIEDAFVPDSQFKSGSSNAFRLPKIFSLTDGNSESYLFLRQLFDALYHERFEKIILDYSE